MWMMTLVMMIMIMAIMGMVVVLVVLVVLVVVMVVVGSGGKVAVEEGGDDDRIGTRKSSATSAGKGWETEVVSECASTALVAYW